jgi:hypothetical protein
VASTHQFKPCFCRSPRFRRQRFCRNTEWSTKGPFINYIRVSREEGRGFWKISTYSYFGERRSHHSYIIFSKSIFYIRNQVVWQGSYFICAWKVKKPIRSCCFSVTDPFLTTFYYVEKRNGILRKNIGEGFENSYVPLHGGGVKNCQNYRYVINEWLLSNWSNLF